MVIVLYNLDFIALMIVCSFTSEAFIYAAVVFKTMQYYPAVPYGWELRALFDWS